MTRLAGAQRGGYMTHSEMLTPLASVRSYETIGANSPTRSSMDRRPPDSSRGRGWMTPRSSTRSDTILRVTPLSAPSVERYTRSEEHTSELQSRGHLVCRLLLENKK